MACDGNGTTIVFGTSAFSANLLSVNPWGYERGSIPTSHMGTTDAMTFCPGSLYDGGSVEITFEYDGTQSPPVSEAAEAITIDVAGGGVGKKVGFDAFMTGYGATVEMDGRMTSSMTLKVTGEVAIS